LIESTGFEALVCKQSYYPPGNKRHSLQILFNRQRKDLIEAWKLLQP